jgi:hypothetical protein
MIPAHSVSMRFTLTFITELAVSAEPEVCANSLTMATHVLSSSQHRLSRSIRDDCCCSLTQVATRPSSSFEPFLHTRGLPFLIQNT